MFNHLFSLDNQNSKVYQKFRIKEINILFSFYYFFLLFFSFGMVNFFGNHKLLVFGLSVHLIFLCIGIFIFKYHKIYYNKLLWIYAFCSLICLNWYDDFIFYQYKEIFFSFHLFFISALVFLLTWSELFVVSKLFIFSFLIFLFSFKKIDNIQLIFLILNFNLLLLITSSLKKSWLKIFNDKLRYYSKLVTLRQEQFLLKKYQKEEELYKKEQNDEAAFIQKMLMRFDACPLLNVRSFYKPSENLGGDLVMANFDETNQVYYLVMLDVIGHGASAALITGTLTASIKRSFHFIQKSYFDPFSLLKIIMNNVNEDLLSLEDRSRSLTTGIFLAIDIKNKKLYYLNNANHSLYIKTAFEVKNLVNKVGLLGQDKIDLKNIKDKHINFSRDDFLFCFTDGLIENSFKETKKPIKFRTILNLFKNSIDIDILDQSLQKEVIDNMPVKEDDITYTIIKL